MEGLCDFLHSCRGKRESLNTDADRLVDLMMGKEGSSCLIAFTFVIEVSSLRVWGEGSLAASSKREKMV